eukprot:gnl/MRDRNA2_/MRDRNA2_160313_c0_seq1.p1 gnl/MRDRNA2_/MRDRNA2_160313_c0~~gnl/MRDRNA2_/MRDRNA2_160313_c0_seq1.p1  ORF type:complete len:458 (+),score=84.57 gnl/MRDRNA2_/MRDRNA2_160313_c0_seq1:97-1470(+)
MWSPTIIFLFTFVAHASAQKLVSNQGVSMPESINLLVDKLVDKLVNQFTDMRNLAKIDLDGTTLRPLVRNLKLNHASWQHQARLFKQHHSRPSGQHAQSRDGPSWSTRTAAYRLDPPQWTSQAALPVSAKAKKASNIAILFDFDGTLADTEDRAMEVTFWELAPYMPNTRGPEALSHEVKDEYIARMAGNSFEFMLEDLDRQRAKLSLDSVEVARAAGSEDASVLAIVNEHRTKLGLPCLEATRAYGMTLPQLQKEEQIISLGVAGTHANKGVFKTLDFLHDAGVRFAISTTSPKSRVDVCMDRSGLREWFAPEKIHSGESDFDPPCFKPHPAVYLKAAAAEETDPKQCIAVEDSPSGVGAAANAGIGLIVGYVGASHISAKNEHALKLLAGTRSRVGRGADIVLSELEDLVHVVKYVMDCKAGLAEPFIVEPVLTSQLNGRFWIKQLDHNQEQHND